MEEKEKIVQIYEKMADMTLEMINKSKENALYLDDNELEMVRTTQSLYETINHANQPVIATISSDNFIPEDKNGKHYENEPSVKR